jgi:hypothetical protein
VDIQIQAVLGQNITLLFKSLELQAIDRNKLRGLLGADDKPAVIDTPDQLVAVFPRGPLFVQLGENRIRITLPQATTDIGVVPLWAIANKCNRLVPKANSWLSAYGFNYDLQATLPTGNARQMVVELFAAAPHRIEAALQGRLVSFVPRLRFERDRVLGDMVIEPVNDQIIQVHLNSHFPVEGTGLPGARKLEASYRREYEFLTSVLPRLFDKGV